MASALVGIGGYPVIICDTSISLSIFMCPCTVQEVDELKRQKKYMRRLRGIERVYPVIIRLLDIRY